MDVGNAQLPVDPGNVPSGTASPEQPGNTTQPVALTKEDIAAIVKEETSKAFKGIQSMQAKQEERIKAEVKNRIDALVQAGVQLAPEQQMALAQHTRDQLSAEYTDPSATQAATPPVNVPAVPQQPIEPPPDPVSSAAIEMIRKSGLTLDQSDPEFGTVNTQTQDPYEFLTSVKAAIDSKRERITRTSGPAAVPGAVAAGGTPSSLQAQYEKAKQNIRRGDVDALFRLQVEYRKKGLSV